MPNITRFLLPKFSSTTHVFTKKRIISFAVLSLLLISMFYIGQMTAFPNTDEIVINPDYSFWKAFDIIVGKVSSTYHAVSGDTGESRSSGSNDDPVIQYAIDTLSAVGGGSVGVRAAAYNASVVLKNGVRLVIEKGATGITVSVNAGATCWLEDYTGAVKYFYSSGSLVWKEDLASGEFWWGSENRTDTLAYPESESSYVIFEDSGVYKAKNGSTGQIDYQNTNALLVFNNAIGNSSSGATICVRSASYIINGSIIDVGQDHITLFFENGAKLIVADNSNVPPILLQNVAYWSIEGGEIDGNRFNQESLPVPDGVMMVNCSYCVVKNMYIHDCHQEGIYFYKECVGCRAENNYLSYNDWNGITIGGDGVALDCLVTGNWISHSGDVGIAMNVANNTIVAQNHIWSMYGVFGYNNASWGIATENSGGYDSCRNTISDNVIYDVKTGICIRGDNNVISGNQISEWDITDNYDKAIWNLGGNHTFISDNQIVQSLTHTSEVGIKVEGGEYVTVQGNKISGNNDGATIQARDGANYCTIIGNTITNGEYNIAIVSGIVNATIAWNVLINIDNGNWYSDAGTDTVIHDNIVNGTLVP